MRAHPQRLDSVRLGMGPQICIADRFPGEAELLGDRLLPQTNSRGSMHFLNCREPAVGLSTYPTQPLASHLKSLFVTPKWKALFISLSSKDSNLPYSIGIHSRPAAPRRLFSFIAFMEFFLVVLGEQ